MTNSRETEVRARGTVGRWTADPERWYRVIRRNRRSLTIAGDGGILTLPRDQVVEAR
jgi:hypothetical protein